MKLAEDKVDRKTTELWRNPLNWVPKVQGVEHANLSGKRTKLVFHYLFVVLWAACFFAAHFRFIRR